MDSGNRDVTRKWLMWLRRHNNMTDYEDNKDILVKLTVLWKSWGVDIESGKIRPCDKIRCYKCKLFNGVETCQEKREKWLDEECIDSNNIN